MTMKNCDYLPLLDSGLNDSLGSSARISGPRRMRDGQQPVALYSFRHGVVGDKYTWPISPRGLLGESWDSVAGHQASHQVMPYPLITWNSTTKLSTMFGRQPNDRSWAVEDRRDEYKPRGPRKFQTATQRVCDGVHPLNQSRLSGHSAQRVTHLESLAH